MTYACSMHGKQTYEQIRKHATACRSKRACTQKRTHTYTNRHKSARKKNNRTIHKEQSEHIQTHTHKHTRKHAITHARTPALLPPCRHARTDARTPGHTYTSKRQSTITHPKVKPCLSARTLRDLECGLWLQDNTHHNFPNLKHQLCKFHHGCRHRLF